MSFADILLQILAGWLIADFLSGLFHWLEDRVLWASMPVLGRHIVAPNRLHHAQPSAFMAASVWVRNATSWPLVLAIAAAWFALAGFSPMWLGALIGGLVAQEVHVLAHRRPHAGLLGVLQQIGVIQHPRQHGQHHRGAMDARYCVLTGWLNPILDWAGFWAALERIIAAVGLEPNRGTK